MPTVTYDPNDILIINDDDDSPAGIVSTTSDAIASFVDPFPGGEAGCCLPDGIFCISHNGENDFAIYDGAFTQIALVNLGAEFGIVGSGIQSNRVDKFYVITYVSGTTYRIRRVATDGTIEATITTVGASGGAVIGGGPCVARDGSILYYYTTNTVAIKRFDLNTETVLSDLYTIGGSEGAVCGAVDADGNIWYTFVPTGGGAGVTLRQFDPSGTVLQTITVDSGIYEFGGRTHISSDDLAIWVWLHENAADPYNSAFKEILFSDGSTRHFTTGIPTKFLTSGTDSISNSCPLIVLSGFSDTSPGDITYKSIVWPVWLKDGTFIVFDGSYLGNGSTLRFDLDGKLVKKFDYDHADFTPGMYNQAALLDDNSCLPEIKGMIWLAGHHSPPVGVVQPAIQPIDIETGQLFPIVNVIPAVPEVDISAGLTALGARAYSPSDGEPTDQGLPPKPDVSCAPISNLRTPQPNPCCNAGGIHPVASYTGPSGTVPSAPDPTGEETLTGKTAVFVDVEIDHTDYPAETPETLRYALVELDDEFRKEGRIESIGDVEHGLSDPQGNMESASINITIMDAEGEPIGSRMLDAGLKYFARDPITVRARSDWGRRFGDSQSPAVIPRQIGRGLLYGESYGTSKVAQLTANDPFFVDGGSFSPDKKVPQFTYPLKYYVNAPPDLANYFVPIIIGEVTDRGAKDPSTGLVNERGKCPGRFVGMDTTLGTLWGRINNNLYASYAITDLYGSDCGGLGCYGRIARSDGKSPSTISLDGTSDFTVIPAGGWAQLVLYTANGRSEHRITKVNIAAHSVRVEGQIDPTVLVGEIPWFIERIDHIPRRVKIDIAARQGDDVMIPGYAGYVRSTPYEDFTVDGTPWRVTDYWVRGVLLAEHLNGRCTLATNTIGVDAVGNATGPPIVDYFTGFNWFLDNCVHEQRTCPPINDDTWATNVAELPAWPDGWTKTKSSDFERMQAQTAISLGGYGLRLGAYFDEGISIRDAMQLWNDNALCRTYIDEWGRVGVWILDEEADPSLWPKLEHVSRVFGSVRRWRALDEAMNVVRGGTEWDPDQREFRFEDVEVRSTGAIQRNKGILRRSKHYDGKIVFDYKHFEYLLGRQLWMQQDGPIYVSIENGDIGWLDYPVGSGIQFNSIMLPGGDANVYWLVILKKTFHVDTHTVSVLCLEAGSEMTAGQEGTLLVPSSQQFLVTDDDSVAPVVSDDSAVAPVVAQ